MAKKIISKKIIKKTVAIKKPKNNITSKIVKNSTLAKILKKKGADKILAKNGVPCLSCPMASFEIDDLKIGDVCKMYGLNIDKILKDLNKK